MLLSGCEAGVEPDRLDAAATRIVALSPHLTELAYSAGAGDRLVGVVEYSDYPPAALDLPRIGDSFRLDYEAIAGLAPDLVLAWRSGTPADVQQRLRELGYRVESLDANRLVDIAAQIAAIGALAGTSATADAAASAFLQRLRGLADAHREAGVVDVFYQISAQPLFTISGRHVISEAIELCGGRNIFADTDGLSPAVSLESVIVAEPEVIVWGQSPPSGAAADELRDQWSRWSSVPAVRDGHLFVVDADRIHRPTTRILDAVDELCMLLDAARQ